MGLRILYGVNGEGLGHATRSQVVAGALLERHDVRVVTSGGALAYLRERLPDVEEVFGPSFAMENGEIRRWATVRHNLATAPRELPVTVRHWLEVVDAWRPDVVVTDFEPLAGLYARSAHVPLVSVDNIHMIDRCRHDDGIVGDEHADFAIARAVTRAMVPTAGDYVITTFFRPPVLRGRTRLVEPLLRPEVLAAAPERGDHLLVYSGGEPELLAALRDAPLPSRVYGMRDLPEAAEDGGRVTFRPRSEAGFLEDLRTARAVVTGGGFSLLCEAIALRKPVLSVPLHGQFEQTMNARYLERAGYGRCAGTVDGEALAGFLGDLARFESALDVAPPPGNDAALRTIEDVVCAAAADSRAERRALRRVARRPVA